MDALSHWSLYALGNQMGHRMLLEPTAIMALALLHWSPYALGTNRKYGFGIDALVTVCSWNPNAIMVLAWMHWSPYALGTRTQ